MIPVGLAGSIPESQLQTLKGELDMVVDMQQTGRKLGLLPFFEV
jgi:hypothetical protein